MKTIFRTLGLGALTAAFMAIGGVTVFAQDPCADLDAINALDAKVRADYPKLETKPQAIDEGKQYLEKYGNCEVTKEFSGWLKGQIPKWEQIVAVDKKQKEQGPLNKRFDDAFTAKTYDDAFAAGSEYIAKFPDDPTNINRIVTLGMIGPRETASKNYKFNANSEKFAKMALDQLKNGNPTPTKSGGYGFQLGCPSKEDCISTLTFGIGFMNFYGNNNKEAALPYYYEVTRIPGTYKNSPNVYSTIGDYYFETVSKLDVEVKAAIADQKDTDTDEVRQKKIADIKAKVALENGYTERAMDAYSRAYTFAKADASSKTLADTLYKKVQALYGVRFQKTEGVDTWISSAVAKPFPDPTSTVAPIADPETSGESGSTGPAAKPTATPASTPVKPATTPAKPGTKVGENKSGMSDTTTPSTTTLAAKPAPRRKGNH
jgi:tetratricopeptide (TPR) repeat protein